MEKRKLIIGNYDTALEGLWTLSALKLGEPALKSEYVSIPGRSGDLDLSTVLTDGVPIYSNRTLEATLESSEGTREERNDRISYMINALDGFSHNIILPDDSLHYLVGRVKVSVDYSDLAHSSVTLTANCEPWLYNIAETQLVVEASAATTWATLRNRGRKAVIPTVKVEGNGFDTMIKFGDSTWTLSDGTYELPEIYLKTGSYSVGINGAGTVTFTYREAVLR